MAKGSAFERDICKQLSRWWTGGKRDDVFWRSSQSGGRATQRMKSGKRTYGSYGDITAVDPIGEPLLKLFTIELKRGRAHRGVGDMIDARPSRRLHPFAKCLLQTYRSAQDARSSSWMLIGRRDFREAIAYVEWAAFRELNQLSIGTLALTAPPFARFSLEVGKLKLSFAVLPLALLLKRLSPERIRAVLSA